MSSDEEKVFVCYECDRTVTITVSSSTSSSHPFHVCPFCNQGFLVNDDYTIQQYFIIPVFNQLIRMLATTAENDRNRSFSGNRPASKSAIESLKTITIGNLGIKQCCSICKEEFEIGVKVKQMPCEHLYHHHCLLPWLQLNNSCPLCRFELPTDDSDHHMNRSPVQLPESASENQNRHG